MPEVKADVRLKKQMEVSIPPSVNVTKLIFSPRIHNGQIVVDIRFPDNATKVKHQMKDGNYLFREPGSWWRATRVQANVATGGWIESMIEVPSLKGEWHGPLADDNPEWRDASQDIMGRLFRAFEPGDRTCHP